jgi:hypothetical protein
MNNTNYKKLSTHYFVDYKGDLKTSTLEKKLIDKEADEIILINVRCISDKMGIAFSYLLLDVILLV